MIKKLFYKGKLLLSVMFVACCLSTGCKKSSSSQSPGANQVWMQNMAFNPLTLTVTANTTVTWTNMDGYAHTVNGDTATSINSGNINASTTYSHLFTTPGAYAYHCNIHSNMHATIIIH